MFFMLNYMSFLKPMDPKMTNPKSISYNLKTACHYHSGTLGHDTKDCIALRFNIQNLLENSIITFEPPSSIPNIHQKPLSEHVNMVDVDMNVKRFSRSFTPVNTHYRRVKNV